MAGNSRWLRSLARVAGSVLRAAAPRSTRTNKGKSRHIGVGAAETAMSSTAYPGDFVGMPSVSYEPDNDSEADPGEVVWTWVPYEEDATQGKDRPVLAIGWDGPWLLVLPVTSKDHDLDAAQEAAAGRYWCDIGTGAWDRRRRPSEARVNRIVRVDPAQVRRTGGRLSQDRFNQVVSEMRRHF